MCAPAGFACVPPQVSFDAASGMHTIQYSLRANAKVHSSSVPASGCSVLAWGLQRGLHGCYMGMMRDVPRR